jgi:RNA polymerase-interacting CarD/CdnL/TRCF family regulator
MRLFQKEQEVLKTATIRNIEKVVGVGKEAAQELIKEQYQTGLSASEKRLLNQ